MISGAGWVTPLGADLDTVWTKLLSGASAIGPVTRFPAETYATNFAAEVRGFSLDNAIPNSDRFNGAHINTQYALAAAASAWRNAGLPEGALPQGLKPHRCGIYLGAGEGTPGFDAFASANLAGWNPDTRTVDGKAWAETAYKLFDAQAEIEQEPNRPVQHLSEAFNARGPAFNCMTACAASTQSIGEAREIIARGDADIMIAGGTHSMIHPLGMTGFIRLTAMSKRRDEPTTASRPFDRTRDGFVMGEGAGIVILESLDHALARGATPLAEVAGYGSSADAYRITDIQPQGKGAIAAMRQALTQAGIDPTQHQADGRPGVHYISAHGTSTKENDAIETKAVKGVFGDLAPHVPFSSVKSMMGHLIQAAGAVELITCIQAIKTGWVPPTMNLSTPDPDCDLDYVPNQARDLNELGGVRVAMSNGFGFGGQNNCLVLKAYDPS